MYEEFIYIFPNHINLKNCKHIKNARFTECVFFLFKINYEGYK